MNTITINGQTFEIDGPLNDVRITAEGIFVGGVRLDCKVASKLEVHWNGPTANVEVRDGNLTVYSFIQGHVRCDGNVSCQNIFRSVNAKGNVHCADVTDNVSAGGNVHCGDVGGSVTAGGNIKMRDKAK